VDADIEHLIRYLMAHMKCAVCHRPYSPEDFEVLDEGEALLVILITCHHCHAQGLLVAFMQEHEPQAREAERTEVADEMEGLKPITADDVLDMHRFLEHFSGDFNTLVRGPSTSQTHGEEINGRTGRLAEGDP